VSGCSAEATAKSTHTLAPTTRSLSLAMPLDAGAERAPEAPTPDALALLGPMSASGLREVSRGESALPASIPVPTSNADVCLRAVLAAGAPVTAALVGDGRVLAMSEAGPLTWLDTRGPICLKRGTEARIEVQGSEGPVRYVLWMAP
jgi:hypothetical protein